MGAADQDFAGSDVAWMRHLATAKTVAFKPLAENTVCGLMQHFAGTIRGSVRYESDGYSIFVALTIAGLENLVPVSATLAAKYSCLASLRVVQTVHNFTDEFAATEWAINNLLPRTSRTVLWNADMYNNNVPGGGATTLMSVSYPISERAFIMNLCPLWKCDSVECHHPTSRKATPHETELYIRIVSSREELVSVFGWSDPEHAFTNITSHAGGVVFCSFRTSNLAFWAAISKLRATKPLPLPQHDRGIPLDRTKTYLVFETNEGDTPRIITSQFDSSWLSPKRGSIPVAWAVDPLLGEMFPELLNFYVSSATTNDTFVAGLDGAGYVYLGSLGTHAAAYETRAAEYSSRFHLPVVDVGVPGVKSQPTTIAEIEAYVATARRRRLPPPAMFLNACGSHFGQPLLSWLRDGTPVLNSVCTGPGNDTSNGHYLYYYHDHLNKTDLAGDLASHIRWARESYGVPGEPTFLLLYGGLGSADDFFRLQTMAITLLASIDPGGNYQVIGSAELARLARQANPASRI